MARQEIDLTTPQPNGKMGEPTKSAWEKVNDMTAELYGFASNVTTEFITGFKMRWNASNNVSISEGAAYIPGLNKVVKMASALNITGITFPAESWGHFYLYDNAGVGTIEYSSIAPSNEYSAGARTKSGDNTRRYIGSFRTLSVNQVARFVHDNHTNTIFYILDINTPFMVALNGGTSSSSTNVSCSTAVPVTSRMSYLLMENGGTSAAQVAYVANPDMGDVSPNNFLRYVRINNTYESLVPLNSSQQFNYLTSGVLVVRVIGYIYSR